MPPRSETALCRNFAVKSQPGSRAWRQTAARCPICLRRSGPTGALTKEEMKNCVWLKPELVAQIEFTKWAPDGHLRQSKFVGLRKIRRHGRLCERIEPAIRRTVSQILPHVSSQSHS